MSESKGERRENIIGNFESILPKLWEQGRQEDETLKIEYMKTLHAKLLNVMRNQLTIPVFYTYFTGFSIEDISSDVSIIFGTNTNLKKEKLESEYLSLLKAVLTSITRVDYEISFVVNEENPVPEPLGDKTLEELWIMAYGEKDLEERKALQQMRRLKPDNADSECNYISCPSCDNEDVPNVDIDFPLETRNNNIRSIRVKGAKCSGCGEEYINVREVRVIEEIIKLLDNHSMKISRAAKEDIEDQDCD